MDRMTTWWTYDVKVSKSSLSSGRSHGDPVAATFAAVDHLRTAHPDLTADEPVTITLTRRHGYQ